MLRELSKLDDRLIERVEAGDIRFVRPSWLQQASTTRILRRQDLEALEASGECSPLLSTSEAVALIKQCDRSTGALTYGWQSPGSPDIAGTRLEVVRQALAENKKLTVREKVADLRRRFSLLLAENTALPSAEQLPRAISNAEGAVDLAITMMSAMQQFWMVIIDAHEIGQYRPQHTLWPTWLRLSKKLTDQVGADNHGLNISASNQGAITEAFKQVETAMEAGGAAG